MRGLGTGQMEELPLSNFLPVGSMSLTSKISSTRMPAILLAVYKDFIHLILLGYTVYSV